jgi:hypothetical protein
MNLLHGEEPVQRRHLAEQDRNWLRLPLDMEYSDPSAAALLILTCT